MNTRQRPYSILLLGLLLSVGTACLPIGRWVDEFRDVPHLLYNEMVWWSITAVVLAYVTFVEGRPLSSVGLRRPGLRQIGVAILFAVATICGFVLIIHVAFPLLHLQLNDAQVARISAAPLWWRLISVGRAAVAEEVLFRGYALERLSELTGSRAWGAVLSCAVFAAAHLGAWGWAHLIIAGFGGAMFTLLYLWRRNLWLTIIAHFIVDFAAFL